MTISPNEAATRDDSKSAQTMLDEARLAEEGKRFNAARRKISVDRGLAISSAGLVAFCLLTLALGLTGTFTITPAGLTFLGSVIIVCAAVMGFRYLDAPQILKLSRLAVGEIVFASKMGIGSSSGLDFNSTNQIIKALIKRQSDLEQQLKDLQPDAVKANLEQVASSLKQQLYNNASDDFIEFVERRVRSIETDKLYQSRHVMELVDQTGVRINDALISLERRGNVNLIIGGLITLAGALLLCYFVLFDKPNTNIPIEYLMHSLPRLAIIALTQVFALFFLRLYKLGLSEIKFFQNEMTTIEQRHFALSISLLQDDASVTSAILETIASTDRNNVLEKGQSTIDIEKARLEAGGNTVDVLKSIIPLIQRGR